MFASSPSLIDLEVGSYSLIEFAMFPSCVMRHFSFIFCYNLEKLKVIQDYQQDHYLNFVLVLNMLNMFYQQQLLLNVQLMHYVMVLILIVMLAGLKTISLFS